MICSALSVGHFSKTCYIFELAIPPGSEVEIGNRRMAATVWRGYPFPVKKARISREEKLTSCSVKELCISIQLRIETTLPARRPMKFIVKREIGPAIPRGLEIFLVQATPYGVYYRRSLRNGFLRLFIAVPRGGTVLANDKH